MVDNMNVYNVQWVLMMDRILSLILVRMLLGIANSDHEINILTAVSLKSAIMKRSDVLQCMMFSWYSRLFYIVSHVITLKSFRFHFRMLCQDIHVRTSSI